MTFALVRHPSQGESAPALPPDAPPMRPAPPSRPPAPRIPRLPARLDAAALRAHAERFARLALGAAFLSGIASRFGWWGAGVGYGDFAHFERYTAEVNAF